VVGYNMYRSTASGSFVMINTSPVALLSYVDTAVVSGTTYTYVVKSIDSSGLESVASNPASSTVP
jgi:fibronectin type 3 domain-containing protein